MTSLQDHVAEAIARAFLACPLRCPKEVWKLCLRVLRKRENSRNRFARAMEEYRRAWTAYLANNAGRLPEILEAVKDAK